MATSSVFIKPVKKNWKVQFYSSDHNKDRFEEIKKRLEAVDPGNVFDLAINLESELNLILNRAEKEVTQLESERQKASVTESVTNVI